MNGQELQLLWDLPLDIQDCVVDYTEKPYTLAYHQLRERLNLCPKPGPEDLGMFEKISYYMANIRWLLMNKLYL